MKNFESIFNWVNLNQGRARFLGGIRGADEIGHETFAVQNDSGVYYGEIKKTSCLISAITTSKLSPLDILILRMLAAR
jgi:hypothetical protein